MGKLFVSHSTNDDGFVRELQRALDDWDEDVWIDSRQLLGGDLLWAEVKKAIDEADAYLVVVSPAGLQSEWVGDELAHALETQKRRGKDDYPVIPLSLDGTQLGVLKKLFGEAPAYIDISSAAGGIEAAMDKLLAALGLRLLADLPPTPQPQAELLEDLVLELSDLKIYAQAGLRRAQAKARLVYQAATVGRREVASPRWTFIAPLGPIEAGDLRWYLEKYAIWPSRYYQERVVQVEQNLVEWGKLLHQSALPPAHTGQVLQAWARVDGQANRRFSVLVDNTPEAGQPEEEAELAREAATLLLGLPWELLHDGDSFLFQGAKPVRVRRRLPNTRDLDVPVLALPIRVLLVTARPEDEACGYLDHRASALPLVEATEALGGLLRLHLLNPPSFPALGEELERARKLGQPYHVVHFDGHGVYSRTVGLGGLCFEDPQDAGKLEGRRHQTVYTDQLGPLLKQHRIPLVFLEACQTAQAEAASESVASELLNRGVASVVAMSHSVLVETASRFVRAFYQALAVGERVGEAMLAGQRKLKDDSFRGRVFGAGELRLQDWFVPVLFQEREDPQLFRALPRRQTQDDVQAVLRKRQGELPPPPPTGFIGRSRELLALQRLWHDEAYAVLLGQGGEGKTALACEFARWMLRAQQVRRLAFVSVETHGTAQAVLDALGRQLLPDYSVAAHANLEQALLPVRRALREKSTLLVLDNLESLLPPPYLAGQGSELWQEDQRRELQGILALCECLLWPDGASAPLPPFEKGGPGGIKILFTSRETLPAPFDKPRNQRTLRQLAREDAVKLVERVLDSAEPTAANKPRAENPFPSGEGRVRVENPLPSGEGRVRDQTDARTEAIEQLVDAVQAHARTLALLAPALREYGLERTQAELRELMAQMHRDHPDSREHSLYASVALSLRRLSPASRAKAQVLGLFQGGVQLDVLRHMTQWEQAELASLAAELTATGLATPNRYNHLSLNPALCPYLLTQMTAAERQAGAQSWRQAMWNYAEFLYQQSNQDAEMAATLTGLELPNLLALLDAVRREEDAAATIELVTRLYRLLQNLGKPRLLERLGQVRDAAAQALGEAWSHARFEAQRTHIEQQLAAGRLPEALAGARDLLERARAAGPQAYPGADYDLAGVCFLLARVSRFVGAAEASLPLLQEARLGFETIARQQANKAAEGMASACLTEQGDCLQALGRLDEAAAAYEEAIQRAGQLGAERDVAVGQIQLGTVRLFQRRYPEALEAYAQARAHFNRLDESASVAAVWHQTGMAYQKAGQLEPAEDAYRLALAIKVRLGDAAGQASTLNQLGLLYDKLGRTEEAVSFLRLAAERYAESGDLAGEGGAQNNLAIHLFKLRRLGEARQAIRRAIACKAHFGHAAEPWTSWDILGDIETEEGHPAAAAEARAKARAAFLAYRRDGGENHNPAGRLALAVRGDLQAGQAAAALAELRQLADDPRVPELLRLFVQILQAIAQGSRDPALAETPGLHYAMAAEILLLLEAL